MTTGRVNRLKNMVDRIERLPVSEVRDRLRRDAGCYAPVARARAPAVAAPAAYALLRRVHLPGGASVAGSCGRAGTPRRRCRRREGTTAVGLAGRPPVTGRPAAALAAALHPRERQPHRASVDVRSPRVTRVAALAVRAARQADGRLSL